MLEGTYTHIGLLSDMSSVVPPGASGNRLWREGPSQGLPAPRAKPGHRKIRAATASTRHDITSGVLRPASSTQGMISALVSLISYTSYTTSETLGWRKGADEGIATEPGWPDGSLPCAGGLSTVPVPVTRHPRAQKTTGVSFGAPEDTMFVFLVKSLQVGLRV